MPVNLINIGEITPDTSPLVVNGSLDLVGTGPAPQYMVNGVPIGTSAFVDPTTTLGDLIVRGATTTTRLGVGTNGQVLRADSTVTATGVAWQTLDAANLNLNPTGSTWTTIQDAIEGLETLSPETLLTTKGDILGFTTTPARIPVGATNNWVFMVDAATASGVKWAAYTADLMALNPTVGTWTTVQNAISGISTTLTGLSRGMAYVGHYDAAADVATFVPSMSSLSGPLPAADATGIDEGDYLVVTTATTGPPALNVGDQLISGGASGGANWNILPIGHSLATVTAATVPLSPVIGTWNTVQDAVTGLNTRAQAAGAAGQIQFNGGGVPAGFAASANLFWDTANGRLGVHQPTPAYAVDVTGAINCTLGLYVDGVLFAEPGSAHLHATDIAGLDGKPLKLIAADGREIELDALLSTIDRLEARLRELETR